MKKLVAWIKRQEGFTLIEMSLVLFIISALLLLFVPNLSSRQSSASDTGDEAIASVLQAQVDLYKMDNSNLPPASFEVMKTSNYLTDKQHEKALEDFKIVDGVVTPK